MSDTLTPVFVASVVGATFATLGTIATLYLAGSFSQPSTSQPENGHAWKERGHAGGTRANQGTDLDPAQARCGISGLLPDVLIRCDSTLRRPAVIEPLRTRAVQQELRARLHVSFGLMVLPCLIRRLASALRENVCSDADSTAGESLLVETMPSLLQGTMMQVLAFLVPMIRRCVLHSF